MREGQGGPVEIQDVKAPVFRALLCFAYTDSLPEELQGSKLEVAMAQHLLAAADRFQLIRLRCICEQRLCETVEVRPAGAGHARVSLTAGHARGRQLMSCALSCSAVPPGTAAASVWSAVAAGCEAWCRRCRCPCRSCLQVETVATTLALAEQNNARELKRVCLEFVSKNLQAVMESDGYQYMTATCPQLQSELLQVIAHAPPARGTGRSVHIAHPAHGTRAADESSTDGQLRRVRPRRE